MKLIALTILIAPCICPAEDPTLILTYVGEIEIKSSSVALKFKLENRGKEAIELDPWFSEYGLQNAEVYLKKASAPASFKILETIHTGNRALLVKPLKIAPGKAAEFQQEVYVPKEAGEYTGYALLRNHHDVRAELKFRILAKQSDDAREKEKTTSKKK